MNNSPLSSRELCVRAEEVIDDSLTELLMFQCRMDLFNQRCQDWYSDQLHWQEPRPTSPRLSPKADRDRRFMRDLMEYESRRAA